MQFDIGDDFFLEFLTAMQQRHVRYMLIGDLAVNFHGFIRNTQDMDIWLAPTTENRDLFYEVLLDLGYTTDEIGEYKNEDFTTFFKCSIGTLPHSIDCLTFVHPNIDFDEAEKAMILTHRNQDWADVARLDELNKKK
jgi:hypothetical protein